MSKTHSSGPRLGVCVVACVFWALPATAQEHPLPPQPAVLTLAQASDLLQVTPEELQQLADREQVPARRVGSAWRFNRATLLAWLNGDFELIGDVRVQRRPLASRELEQAAARGLTAQQPQAQPAPTPAPQGSSDQPIGQAPEERTAEEVFLRGRRVLLGRGDVVVDFGQFYTRGDDLQLATGTQGLGLATIRQDVLTSLFLARVGVFNETEFFASTTFNRQRSEVLFGADTLASDTRNQLGSVTFGLNRTLMRERAGRPDVIANVAVHVPTDDAAAYALSGGVSLVKSVDPAVLFASIGYSDVIGNRSASATLFEPAASVAASVGYGLGLNDTMAISTTFSGLFTGSTVINGTPQRKGQFFSGRFAVTSRVVEGLYIEPSVSFGISGPSDSVAFGVTIPYSF